MILFLFTTTVVFFVTCILLIFKLKSKNLKILKIRRELQDNKATKNTNKLREKLKKQIIETTNQMIVNNAPTIDQIDKRLIEEGIDPKNSSNTVH